MKSHIMEMYTLGSIAAILFTNRMEMYTLGSIAAILFTNSSFAEDKTASDKPGAAQSNAGADMEEMTKRWEAYATPGVNHKTLEPLVGQWTVEARFWMGGQGNPPTEIGRAHV